MTGHVPVLVREVVDALQPADGSRYLDGTFGGGGYSTAMLDKADCQVIALDRDPDAIAAGQALAARHPSRLLLIEGRFGDMVELLQAEGVQEVDGVALDLGVSSMQFDQPERGFSFRASGPLDMRMEKRGPSAAGHRQRDRRGRARRHFLALRRGATQPPSGARHRRATQAEAHRDHWRAGRDRAPRRRSLGQGRERSRHARLPGTAHFGQ